MKSAIFALVLAAGSMASADIIKCIFTEPFLSATYSTNTNELKISELGGNGEKIRLTRNVSFQIKGAGEFELLAKNGQEVLSLKITNDASDGMSDMIYPIEGKIRNRSGMELIGGCSSNFLKVKGDQ